MFVSCTNSTRIIFRKAHVVVVSNNRTKNCRVAFKKSCGMPVGSFAGKSLISVGTVIVLLSVLPLSALYGVIILILGTMLLYGEYRA